MNVLLIHNAPEQAYKELITILSSKSKTTFKLVNNIDKLPPTPFESFFEIISPLTYIDKIESFYKSTQCARTYLTTQPQQKYNNNYDDSQITIVEIITSTSTLTLTSTQTPNFKRLYGKTYYTNVYTFSSNNANNDTNYLFESIYQTLISPTINNSSSSIIPQWQQGYFNDWLFAIQTRILPRLIQSINHYCCVVSNKIRTDDEFKFLGTGGANTALLCIPTNDVLRINYTRATWNEQAYKLLKENPNSGFIPIKDVVSTTGIKYLIVPLLTPITQHEPKKYKQCCINVISFLENHKEYCFTDCWRRNFMQNDKDKTYYVSDPDINEEPKFKPNVEEYNNILSNNQAVKISYNYPFYSSICAKHNITYSKFVFSLIALTLFELSGFQNLITYTTDIEQKLLSVIKKHNISSDN